MKKLALLLVLILTLSSHNTISLSPGQHVPQESILATNGKVELKNPDYEYYKINISNTGSMRPSFDDGDTAIGFVYEGQELSVGDVILYNNKIWQEENTLHRIVKIGEDEQGWYARAKGDANLMKDPGNIRAEDIKLVVLGVFY